MNSSGLAISMPQAKGPEPSDSSIQVDGQEKENVSYLLRILSRTGLSGRQRLG
jgi:hypothetical protein